MEDLPSLVRDISPPRLTKRRKNPEPENTNKKYDKQDTLACIEPTLAAVEAGKAQVEDHLAYFAKRLAQASRITQEDFARLTIDKFRQLYLQNQYANGRHFVIHQHNHPRAGVHYDLRLQFSRSSSLSFSIPKGPPGNPNSTSIGRMAIETRVHNLWNHLIESASFKTGSLLIWDTGEYEVLPRKTTAGKPRSPHTTDNDSDSDPTSHRQTSTATTRPENEKLIEAFQARYIRLRLHGTRLPEGYTITLRLPAANDIRKYHPNNPRPFKRRRKAPQHSLAHAQAREADSDEESVPPSSTDQDEMENMDTDSEEDLSTRRNNAYPGSTNTIGSIHQRQWFLSLDRRNSGFVKSSDGMWLRGDDGEGGFEAFLVRGRDFERSVVTGRLARELESDEGVEGFVGRKGWVGVE